MYVTVEDIDGGYRKIREECCAHRFTASRFRRTSRLSIRGRRGRGDFQGQRVVSMRG